jgi:hypothetical protein
MAFNFGTQAKPKLNARRGRGAVRCEFANSIVLGELTLAVDLLCARCCNFNCTIGIDSTDNIHSSAGATMVDLIHITHPSIPHLDASKGHYEFKVRSEELSK